MSFAPMASYIFRSAAVALALFNAIPGSEAVSNKAPGTDSLDTITDIRSRVGALEATFEEAEQGNKKNLIKLKESLEAKLDEAKSVTRATALKSKDVASEIEKLAKENNAILAHVKQVQMENNNWLEDFQSWKGNWTTALEVTSHIIELATAHQPEFDVLSKIELEESRRSASKEHASRIAQIDNAKHIVSFLSTGRSYNHEDVLRATKKAGSSKATTKAILGDLSSGIDAINREYEGKVAEIRGQYGHAIKAEEELHAKLTKELNTLQGTLKNQRHLKEELLAAQKTAEEHRGLLEKQAYAMRVYAQRLSTKAMPNNKAVFHANNSTEAADMTGNPNKAQANGTVLDHAESSSRDFAKGALHLKKWFR